MRTGTFHRLAVLAAISCAVSTALSVSAAPARDTVDPPDQAYPVGQDMYQALNKGAAIQCLEEVNHVPVNCHVTATIKITQAEQKYLGLSTRTLASGIAVGPTSLRPNNAEMEHGLYLLKIPAWVKTRLVAKHVVAMKVLFSGVARYPGVDGNGNPNGTHASSFPSPDDDPMFQFGQGTRYGCRPVARGDIITGYVRYGQTCPN